MGKDFLASNIRALRKYYGESQEELAFALDCTKNLISFYENGDRTPGKERINAIANHFTVTVDDLLHQDLSNISSKRAQTAPGFPYADIMFPIVSSEKALSCQEFKEAFQRHSSFISLLKNNDQSAFEKFDIEKCIELYETAKKNKEAYEAACINSVSLILMFCLFFETATLFETDLASINALQKKHPETAKTIKKDHQDFIKESKQLKTEMYSETSDSLYEMLKELCHSATYSDLAYYYLALCYWVNYTDNSYDLVWNQRVASEMMNSLIMIGNIYAANLIIHVTQQS